MLPRRDLARYPATHIDQLPVFAPEDPVLASVLDSALESFGERGFEGATIGDTSKAVGVTKTTPGIAAPDAWRIPIDVVTVPLHDIRTTAQNLIDLSRM